jgi:cytidyltransferase-like protein
VTQIAVCSSFDDMRSWHMRLLQEAARLGDVHVMLWSDSLLKAIEGRDPKFPQEERRYFVQALRYVRDVTVVEGPADPDALPHLSAVRPDVWVVDQATDTPGKRRFCQANGLEYRVIGDEQLRGFPLPPTQSDAQAAGRKKVLVTGCYDWLHTGHVRFFEEVSEYGQLYVTVGHDTNIRQLKGDGHPQFPQDERRYMVQSLRYVHQAMVASGDGWLDAEPELKRIRPDIYAVNEDGDKPEKRAYCQQHGLEYLVLRRLPKAGLPRRQSTALRGF